MSTTIFADTYRGKNPSVSSSNRSDKKRLSLEAAIAGERAEIEIASRKGQLDMKKGQLDLLADQAEIQELEEKTLREQKMRQMQIELNELSSRKSDSSTHGLQSFSWKDSASGVSDWVDNVLTEEFTLDLQSADNVKFQNQQIHSDQTKKKKRVLSPAQNENDNSNKCLQN